MVIVYDGVVYGVCILWFDSSINPSVNPPASPPFGFLQGELYDEFIVIPNVEKGNRRINTTTAIV